MNYYSQDTTLNFQTARRGFPVDRGVKIAGSPLRTYLSNWLSLRERFDSKLNSNAWRLTTGKGQPRHLDFLKDNPQTCKNQGKLG